MILNGLTRLITPDGGIFKVSAVMDSDTVVRTIDQSSLISNTVDVV